MATLPQTDYESTLTESISATQQTIPVATCPAAGVTSGWVRIDDEIIKFAGNSNPGGAGNLTSCTRGLALSGSSEADAGLGVAHQAGKPVKMTDVHYYYNANLSADVAGPASATDNAIARFDGTTGKTIQNSAATIADTSGDITAGKYNGNTITSGSGTLTLGAGKTLTCSNTLTLTATDGSTLAIGSGGTLGTGAYATIANYAPLNSPTLVTPTLGVATATSINKVAITAPAASATLTIADGKTLTVNDNTTLAGPASLTVAGPVEIATAAETTAGTDATRAVSPDGLAGSDYGKRIVQIKIIDDATTLTTGDGKLYFCIPSELNGYNLVDADAFVSTVSSSGTPTVQIYNLTQTADMLSTRITIDANEYTSYTAAAAPVIDTNNDDVATGDILRIDVDVAGTGTKGLGVILSFQLP